MKIHEYQAKELLAAAGANVPRGIVASSAAEAQKAFDQMGGPVVLKAQIHAGGRGKGRFKDSGKDFGGVKFIKIARRSRHRRRSHVQISARDQADRRSGPKGLQDSCAGSRRHRPRNLSRHGRRSRHRFARDDGLRGRRRRDRRSGRPHSGKDSQGQPVNPDAGLSAVPGAAAGFRAWLHRHANRPGREDHDRAWRRCFSTRIAASRRSIRSWSHPRAKFRRSTPR